MRILAMGVFVCGVVAWTYPALSAGDSQSEPQAPPPSNGSSDNLKGTTYTPVYTTNSGVSVGTTQTPNGGTPTTPPSSTYGIGVKTPVP